MRTGALWGPYEPGMATRPLRRVHGRALFRRHRADHRNLGAVVMTPLLDSEARRESRVLASALRNGGMSVSEIAAEIAVSVSEVARMMLGEHAATAPQRAKLRA